MKKCEETYTKDQAIQYFNEHYGKVDLLTAEIGTSTFFGEATFLWLDNNTGEVLAATEAIRPI